MLDEAGNIITDISVAEKIYNNMQTRCLALEEELRKLKLSPSNSNNNAPPRAESHVEAASQPELIVYSVNKDLDKHIQNLLSEIREYTGDTHPGSFKRSVKTVLKQLNEIDKPLFARRLIAQKIKGKA